MHQTDSLNCNMKKRFEDILDKTLRESTSKNSTRKLYERQLEILNALVDYKTSGCARDHAAKTHQFDRTVKNISTRSIINSSKRSRANRSRVNKSKRPKRSRSKRSRSKRSRSKRSRSKPSKRSRVNRSQPRRAIKDVLDRKILLSETPRDVKKKLSVTLKKNKHAGTGLFAVKPIKKGRTIAYYKMKVHQDNDKKSYKSPTKCMYCFSIYTKNQRLSRNLMGDLDKESAPLPRNNIPYWAYFSNEPSGKQTENSEIDIATKDNYKKREKLRHGDFITYKLKATRDINPGEEIVWCYGEAYGRDYKTNCGYSEDA